MTNIGSLILIVSAFRHEEIDGGLGAVKSGAHPAQVSTGKLSSAFYLCQDAVSVGQAGTGIDGHNSELRVNVGVEQILDRSGNKACACNRSLSGMNTSQLSSVEVNVLRMTA
jgi:hypothetical protein